MNATWKVIPFAPDYEVSDQGEVRRATARKGHTVGQPVQITADDHGYRRVNLWSRGKLKTVRLNRLVCLVFLGDPPSPKHHAAHGNGDKSDNSLSNLRWATKAENEADKVLHGTDNRGIKHPLAKLTEEQVRAIREAPRRHGIGAELARKFGVHRNTINEIRRGDKWTSVGGAR